MKVYEAYLQGIFEERICNEFDHVLPIIADEGNGKSTLIMETIAIYRDIRGLDNSDTDALLNPVVYDREGVKERMANAPKRSIIAVPDAGRVLHKKEAMTSEQVEIEKDLFDVRTKEFLILLGFQDWGAIPSFLQERRAKNVIRIPHRGRWLGYNRQSLDKKIGMDRDEWPSTDFGGKFPSLDGTDLWERYKEIDRKAKERRMAGNTDDDDDEKDDTQTVRDIVNDITDGDMGKFISVHGGNKQRYIDADLIEYDYGLSARKAKKVKKILERDHFDMEMMIDA